MIADYGTFFKKNQGAFLGVKKTFVPRDGYAEDSRYMGTTKVTTTVGEKLEWFEQQAIPFLKDLFSVEATNSKGAQKVELVVDGVSFGWLTALDLMRLKSLLSKKEWDEMYINIPVRSDAEVWESCTDPEYSGREVFQTPMALGLSVNAQSSSAVVARFWPL